MQGKLTFLYKLADISLAARTTPYLLVAGHRRGHLFGKTQTISQKWNAQFGNYYGDQVFYCQNLCFTL